MSRFDPLILFVVLILAVTLLLHHKQYHERPSDYYPEWYRLSSVLHQAVAHGLNHSGLIIGNSWSYTGIDPARVKSRHVRYFNIARGATSSTALMMWIKDHDIFPRVLVVELNAWHLEARHATAFDIIPTPPGVNEFGLFKADLEMTLRYQLEKHAPLATYALNADEALNRWRADTLTGFLKYLFLPDPAKVNILGRARFRHHDNGFEEDMNEYTAEQIRVRTLKQSADPAGYLESKKMHSATEARLLADLTAAFTSHGTRVIFFRLPKDQRVIQAENDITPHIFSTARNLADTNARCAFMDMTGDRDMRDFVPLLSDGGHWTRQGAEAITWQFGRKLQGLE